MELVICHSGEILERKAKDTSITEGTPGDYTFVHFCF